MDPMLFHRESGSSLGSKAILHEILSIVRYSRDEGLQNPKSLSFKDGYEIFLQQNLKKSLVIFFI